MAISENSVVTFNYKLKDEEGNLLDSSDKHGALTYLHGQQNIISGLENAMEGHDEGDDFEITLEPESAYGKRNEDLVFNVSRERMPQDVELKAGMQFEAKTANDQSQLVTLTQINDDEVTLDANHPLAGETLHFNVSIEDVREATDEEKQQGNIQKS